MDAINFRVYFCLSQYFPFSVINNLFQIYFVAFFFVVAIVGDRLAQRCFIHFMKLYDIIFTIFNIQCDILGPIGLSAQLLIHAVFAINHAVHKLNFDIIIIPYQCSLLRQTLTLTLTLLFTLIIANFIIKVRLIWFVCIGCILVIWDHVLDDDDDDCLIYAICYNYKYYIFGWDALAEIKSNVSYIFVNLISINLISISYPCFYLYFIYYYFLMCDRC